MQRIWAAAAAIVLALVGIAIWQPALPQDLLGGEEPARVIAIETDVDRPGSDILVRAMPKRGVLDCQRLCDVTRGCQAFTFVREGPNGVPECRIKNAKPAPYFSTCCVSGVVVDMGAPSPPAAPVAPAPAAPLVAEQTLPTLLASVDVQPLSPLPPVRLAPIRPYFAPLKPVLVQPAPEPPEETIPEVAVTAPAPSGPPVRSWAAQNRTVSVGRVGRCLDSPGGLPWPNAPRPLQLWDCHGGGNQLFSLVDGVLYAGTDRRVMVIPAIAPTHAGCLAFDQLSQTRTYHMELCRADRRDARSEFQLRGSDQRLTLRSVHAQSTMRAQEGTPLMLSAIVWNNPAQPIWEHLVDTGQLRLRGTDLCLSVPPADSTNGAPAYLDACAGPLADRTGRRAGSGGRDRLLPAAWEATRR